MKPATGHEINPAGGLHASAHALARRFRLAPLLAKYNSFVTARKWVSAARALSEIEGNQERAPTKVVRREFRPADGPKAA